MAMHINNEGIEPADECPWWTAEETRKHLIHLINKETDLVQGYLIAKMYEYLGVMCEDEDKPYFIDRVLHYADLITNNPMEDTNAEN